MARDKTTRSDRPERVRDEDAPNPVWFKPIMFGFMLLGLAWLIVYYVSLNAFPIPDLGVGNILIGFGLILVGFIMTTRWR